MRANVYDFFFINTQWHNDIYLQGTSYKWKKSPVTYQSWQNTYYHSHVPSLLKYHTRHVSESISVSHFSHECVRSGRTSLCYSNENASYLLELHTTAKNILQPSHDPQKQCTLLLMYNLAEPQWISIDCYNFSLSHIVCTKNQDELKTDLHFNDVGKKICSREEIFSEDNCLLFFCLNKNFYKKQYLVSTCSRLNKYPLLATPMVINHTLQNIFHAIESSSTRFVVLSAFSKEIVSISFKTYWMKTETSMDSDEQQKGYLTCVSKAHPPVVDQSIVFKCQAGNYISSAFLFDGEKNCNSNQNDESIVHFIDITMSITCKPLLYKNNQGKCRTFVLQPSHEKEPDYTQKNFTCSNGVIINQDNVADLVADCGQTLDDEMEFVNLLVGNVFHKCKNLGQIPCFPGHSKCYEIHAVCIYRINSLGQLEPCRTGSHIQSCSKFECNYHFKCPDQFCIPWGYLCNGIWDCPEGTDELANMCYERNCSGLFSCKHSTTMCLHLEDVCDGLAECPFKDDEMLCNLQGNLCPSGCTCLNYAIWCSRENVHFLNVPLPYVSSHTTFCNISSLHFLAELTFVIFINISHNSLSQIGNTFHKNKYLVSIDLSFNTIQRLLRLSFFSMDRIRYILLKNNMITTIDKSSFQDLSLLFVLDLSGNSIDVFDLNFLSGICLLHILFVSQNPYTKIYEGNVMTGVDLKIMYTDKHKFCCLKSTSACFHNDSRHVSCSALLPDLWLPVGTFCCASCILILNFISLSSFLTRIPQKKKQPFFIVVSTVNIAHMLFGLCLFAIFTANLYFQTTFPLHEDTWKNSIICVSIFTIQLFYDLFMPLWLSFLSVVRLLVVTKPFTFTVNSKSFVSKILFFSTVVSLAFCILLVKKLPSCSLCLPFISGFAVPILVLFLEIAALVVIAFSHVFIVKGLKASKKAACQVLEVSSTIYTQLVLLFLCYILSWLPASVVYLIVANATYSRQFVMWVTVTLFSINALFNPLLFGAFMNK